LHDFIEPEPTALIDTLINPDNHLHREISDALSRVLRPASVRFKFSIQALDLSSPTELGLSPQVKSWNIPLTKRLWVRCESHRSIDYSLLAEDLARQLRSIDLPDFSDAVFRCVAAGMTDPDWRLRIDLTPPLILLNHWAAWGDIQAITRLINAILWRNGLQVSGILKNWRLHLFCCVRGNTVQFPNKQQAIDCIAPLLNQLSPQGIQGATIYGVQAMSDGLPKEDESPFWTHWLDLPGAKDIRYTIPPLVLAQQGDEQALRFILQRLLNPDIDRTFINGGIGISLLKRKGLLHIMSEAPACPLESQIVDPISKVLGQIALPDILGVRIHGRISGQQATKWNHAIDFGVEMPQLPSHTTGIPFKPTTPHWQQWFFSRGWLRPATSLPTTLSHKVLWSWLGAGLVLVMGLDVSGHLFSRRVQTTATQPPTTATQSPLSYGNTLFDEKVAAYQELCNTSGAPEVLIVGSSRAMRGIDPQVLEQELASRGYAKARVYNFGINGATAQVVDLLLRRLLQPKQLPKLVIWADGARAFNDGRSDRTYATIADSRGFQQLPGNEGAAIAKSQPFIINGYAAVDSFLNNTLAKVSLTYGQRDRLQKRLPSLLPHLLGERTTDEVVEADAINPSGFLSLGAEFEPSTYYQKYLKVSGDSDNDYASFSLTGTQDTATRQTLEFLQRQQIPLVFVNVPLSDRYLDDTRQKYELSFKQYMQNLSSADKLQFVDLVGLWMQDYSFYSDPSHLNRMGAQQVSIYLARNAPINWQVITAAPRKISP
jgi:hypothetical protein